MKETQQSLWDKARKNFWRDKNGKLTVWQFPNVPLWGWLATMLLAKLFSDGNVHDGLTFVSQAFLMIWAYLELTSGLSYFRRVLGAVVIVATVYRHFM